MPNALDSPPDMDFNAPIRHLLPNGVQCLHTSIANMEELIMSAINEHTLSLPQEQAVIIDRMVATGAYASPCEVIGAGLSALQERQTGGEKELREGVAQTQDARGAGPALAVSVKAPQGNRSKTEHAGKTRIEDESPEESLRQCEYMRKQREAYDRGDAEAVAKYRRLIKLAPSSLMARKKLFGADYIRKQGFNTEYADAQYGAGWLDRKEVKGYPDAFIRFINKAI